MTLLNLNARICAEMGGFMGKTGQKVKRYSLYLDFFYEHPIMIDSYVLEEFDSFSMSFDTEEQLLQRLIKDCRDAQLLSELQKVVNMIQARVNEGKMVPKLKFCLRYKVNKSYKEIDVLYKKDKGFDELLDYEDVKSLFSASTLFECLSKVGNKHLRRSDDVGETVLKGISECNASSIFEAIINDGYRSKRDLYVTLSGFVPDLLKQLRKKKEPVYDEELDGQLMLPGIKENVIRNRWWNH